VNEKTVDIKIGSFFIYLAYPDYLVESNFF